jgi:hypothetical protein
MEVSCTRHLWFNLEIAGGDPDEIREEIDRQRKGCVGYLRYKPGWSPSEHKALVTKKEDRREKIVMVIAGGIIGGIIALFFQWLGQQIFGF